MCEFCVYVDPRLYVCVHVRVCCGVNVCFSDTGIVLRQIIGRHRLDDRFLDNRPDWTKKISTTDPIGQQIFGQQAFWSTNFSTTDFLTTTTFGRQTFRRQ